MMKNILYLILSVFAFSMTAQDRIEVQDLYKDYRFITQYVSGFNFMNDGTHYSERQGAKIVKKSIIDDSYEDVIFDGEAWEGTSDYKGKIQSYSFSDTEGFILLRSEIEPVYRHSYKAVFHCYDVKKGALFQVRPEKISFATFDPTGTRIAYVMYNNLYYYDTSTSQHIQVTTDGKWNNIINGSSDWVYEEEFGISKFFDWSPDGKYLAFARFDESEVAAAGVTMHYDESYPREMTFKYPKVGATNADIDIYTYALDTKETQNISTSIQTEYMPRIRWRDNDHLWIFAMNRHQNDLTIYQWNKSSQQLSSVYQEKNKYYINLNDDITFVDNSHYITLSEKSGYNHLYLIDEKNGSEKMLTKGSNEITAYYGYDAKRKRIYFKSIDGAPMYSRIAYYDIRKDKVVPLTHQRGSVRAEFSKTFDYYILTYSTINTPPQYSLHNHDGKKLKEMERNEGLINQQKECNVSKIDFFEFNTSEGVSLNGYMLKPKDFDPTKKYPVLMYQYSGPGSQQVVDSWKNTYYWWFQMLAQKGYIVACIDPRGTGGRGEEFRKMTYMKLGHYETIDQIEGAKYLGNLSYVDKNRIGIFGWSYGGYMSSLCILKGNDVFKSAIAVAPVTNWKWYDSIYTERYMRTVEENPEGYKDNSPVYFADQLKGNYLLVHGISDDNVHVQNSMEMVKELINADKHFDLYLYPNDNHSIYKGNARHHLFTKMTDFILHKL